MASKRTPPDHSQLQKGPRKKRRILQERKGIPVIVISDSENEKEVDSDSETASEIDLISSGEEDESKNEQKYSGIRWARAPLKEKPMTALEDSYPDETNEEEADDEESSEEETDDEDGDEKMTALPVVTPPPVSAITPPPITLGGGENLDGHIIKLENVPLYTSSTHRRGRILKNSAIIFEHDPRSRTIEAKTRYINLANGKTVTYEVLFGNMCYDSFRNEPRLVLPLRKISDL